MRKILYTDNPETKQAQAQDGIKAAQRLIKAVLILSVIILAAVIIKSFGG